jgi:hypothetical protein
MASIELQPSSSLEVGPVKMTRKITFRDEKEEKPIADVILVEKYNQNITPENKGFSCLKCQLL